MRKIECISFRIIGNTNFKKKLTKFVSKFVRGNRVESENCKNSPTQPALKRCVNNLDDVVLRQFFELLLWMNINKIINREDIFWKMYWTEPKYFCTQMKFALRWVRNYNSTKIFNRWKLHNKAVSNLSVFPKKCAWILNQIAQKVNNTILIDTFPFQNRLSLQ